MKKYKLLSRNPQLNIFHLSRDIPKKMIEFHAVYQNTKWLLMCWICETIPPVIFVSVFILSYSILISMTHFHFDMYLYLCSTSGIFFHSSRCNCNVDSLKIRTFNSFKYQKLKLDLAFVKIKNTECPRVWGSISFKCLIVGSVFVRITDIGYVCRNTLLHSWRSL